MKKINFLRMIGYGSLSFGLFFIVLDLIKVISLKPAQEGDITWLVWVGMFLIFCSWIGEIITKNYE